MNITHTQTLKQASVYMQRMVISFEGEKIEIDEGRQAKLSEWDLILDLSWLDSGKLGLRTSDGLEMTLPVAFCAHNAASK